MADTTIHFNPWFSDTPSGDPGSETNPYTSYAALGAAWAGIIAALSRGDRLTIRLYNDDVYRLKFSAQDLKATGITLILDGVSVTSPVHIAGSDVITGWTNVAGDVWRAAWAHTLYTGYPAYDPNNDTIKQWYYGNNPADTHRAEYLSHWEGCWADGYRLTQVIDADVIAELAEGTFYVDQTGGYAYVHLPGGLDPNSHLMEMTVRDLSVDFADMGSVELRNLVLRHSKVGLDHTRCWDILFDNVLCTENTWQGALVESNYANHTLRFRAYKTRFNSNGFSGLKLSFCDRHVLGCVECDDNNWRGAEVGAANWQEAGIKFYAVKNGVYWNLQALRNKMVGLWWDRDCYLLEGHYINSQDNEGAGIFWETSGRKGWFTVEDSIIQANGFNRLGLDCVRGGIHINSAQKFHLLGNNNLVKRNSGGQVYIADSGRTTRSWETSQVETEELAVEDLVFDNPQIVQNSDLSYFVILAGWASPPLKTAFWRSSITIKPIGLALQIVPAEYQSVYLSTHGG